MYTHKSKAILDECSFWAVLWVQLFGKIGEKAMGPERWYAFAKLSMQKL